MTPDSLRSKPSPSKPKPTALKPDDINYLVFEGGGGKGFAFLGAIEVLQQLKVMRHVKGFGGSSAGAITALALSMGMTASEVKAFMLNTNFELFFDPVTPREIPAPGIGVVPQKTEKPETDAIGRLMTYLPLAMRVMGNPELFAPLGRSILAWLQALDPPGPQIAKDWAPYLVYLYRDMGLFSGKAARAEFDSLIRSRYRHNGKLSKGSVTFREHFQEFKKKLLVTGTNLRSGKTQLFSCDDTPEFPVADAVRISMGLPWVYKPYVITDTVKGWPPCGVYIDGGVWNNLPYREFDGESAPAAEPASSLRSRGSQATPTRQTLGLRLAIDPPAKIESVLDLTLQMIWHGLTGSGESQVLDRNAAQCVILDTEGLELLKFHPPDHVIEKIRKRSQRKTLRYFGEQGKIDLDPKIRDDQDDLDSSLREYQAASCAPVDLNELRKALGLPAETPP